MKKLMMICGLLLGMVAFAQAQQGGGRPGGRMGMMNPENRVKQLDEKLKLSDEQKTKLTAIFTEQTEAMKKAREERSEGQNGGGREAMQKMREENEKKINEVLTADQQKTYKAWQEERRAEMQKRMQDRNNGSNNN